MGEALLVRVGEPSRCICLRARARRDGFWERQGGFVREEVGGKRSWVHVVGKRLAKIVRVGWVVDGGVVAWVV